MDAVKCVEAGIGVPDIYREMGIYTATFHKSQAEFGGMCSIYLMNELEKGNRWLKKIYLGDKVKAENVSGALEKKW